MTTWSAFFPATSGPAAATFISGNYVAGAMFGIRASGLWVYGYRWWCCATGQPTAAVKCCLWNPLSPSTGNGALIPNSVAFTGTLTPGSWNTALLPVPLPISLGTPYIAAVAGNGPFPFTVSQFEPAEPFASGIVNGPLVFYSDSSLGATVNPSPYTLPQMPFTTAVSDPTLHMPDTGNNSCNLWVDVIISDVPPAGFAGPYQLLPNKYDLDPAASLDAAVAFNLATEVDLAQPCLTGPSYFWSLPGAASLPTAVGVWNIASQQLVASNVAPAWTNALTGAAAVAGGGKIATTFPAVLLPPGRYKVSVWNANGGLGAWSPRVYNYFGTGAGASGISWGPVSSPSFGNGQPNYIFQPSPGSVPPYTDGHSQEPSNGSFYYDQFIYPNLEVNFNFSSGAPPGAIAEFFGNDMLFTPVPAGRRQLVDLGQRSQFRKRLIW
jgi:hypothetical protein